MVTGRPPTSRNLVKQHVGDGRLARPRQAGEEDRETLLVAGRVAAPQLGGHIGVGEPRGDLPALVEPRAQVGARDVEHPGPEGHLVLGLVLVEVGHVHHHLERHHGDAELGGVGGQQLLGVVGTVERLAVGVVARPGVVAAHDQVGAAVVLADDGVPHRLAGPSHAHGQGQQRQHGGVHRVAVQHRLVAPHPGVVVDVARLGHAHARVDEQVGLQLGRGPPGQLHVGPVHRVAGLERHHLAPPQAGELGPQLGRGQPQRLEVVVRRRLDALDGAAHVDRVGPVKDVGHAGVGEVAGAVDLLDLGFPVGLPHLRHVESGQHDALGVAAAPPSRPVRGDAARRSLLAGRG